MKICFTVKLLYLLVILSKIQQLKFDLSLFAQPIFLKNTTFLSKLLKLFDWVYLFCANWFLEVTMTNPDIYFSYAFGMQETLAIAVVLLLLGRLIKRYIEVLRRFYIPAPVVGGIVFSCVTLVGHETQLFEFTFDQQLKSLLMLAFFTTIGFAASFKMLIKGGIAVGIFLCVSILLIITQNCVGVGMSVLFGLDPLMGLAAGSIALTGGHGTAAAFGPELIKAGLEGGLTVSVAAATFGLVAGCMLGGPVGKRLMNRHHLKHGPKTVDNAEMVEGKLTKAQKNIDENLLFEAITYIIICMGIGHFIILGLNSLGIVLPAYLGPMMVAAAVRNWLDYHEKPLPLHSINVVGGISLQLFLAIALMTMNLWELASLAVPLITILLVQSVIMFLFAYYITFRMMGADYDAAVIATGHCGFGMGATPNAMANMETFTGANGYSPKAFFVVPIVGALFIDFVNATILTIFISIL